MGSLNRAWHEKHRMPKNATEQQRLAWHLAHARHCSCRPIPASLGPIMRKKARRAKKD